MKVAIIHPFQKSWSHPRDDLPSACHLSSNPRNSLPSKWLFILVCPLYFTASCFILFHAFLFLTSSCTSLFCLCVTYFTSLQPLSLHDCHRNFYKACLKMPPYSRNPSVSSIYSRHYLHFIWVSSLCGPSCTYYPALLPHTICTRCLVTSHYRLCSMFL